MPRPQYRRPPDGHQFCARCDRLQPLVNFGTNAHGKPYRTCVLCRAQVTEQRDRCSPVQSTDPVDALYRKFLRAVPPRKVVDG